MTEIGEVFHVLRLPATESEENTSILKFIRGLLSRCDKAQEIYLSYVSYYPTEGLLELMQCFQPHTERSDPTENSFTLLESATNHLVLRKILDCCDKVGHHWDLLLESGFHTDLSDCMHFSIRKLYLFDTFTFTSKVTVQHEIPLCPFLTEMSLENLELDKSVFTALSNAVKNDNLPLLCHLSFAGCWTSLTGKLSELFQSPWPTLTHLDLFDCCTDEEDIKSLTNYLSADSTVLDSLVLHGGAKTEGTTTSSVFNIMFQSALSNIKTLSLGEVSKQDYRSIAVAINNGNLPKLTKLHISMKEGYNRTLRNAAARKSKRKYDMKKLNSIGTASLTDLSLLTFVCSRIHLQTAASSARKSAVTKLDISHTYGICGNLSKMFSEGFPSLKDLILSDCGLNSLDLSTLAKASSEDKLPALTSLDLSCNEKCVGYFQHLFSKGQKWSEMITLNVRQDVESNEDFQSFIHPVHSGALRSLQNLVLSTNNSDSHLLTCRSLKWTDLSTLHVHCACRQGSSDHVKLLQQISTAVEMGLLPQLHALHVTSNFMLEDIDIDNGFRSFIALRETSKAREHLNTLVKSSASLLAKCVSRETDRSCHLYLKDLTRIKSVLGESPTKEYSALVHFVQKVALISSLQGTLPDLKTVCSLVNEAVDNSPDMTDSHRYYCRYLGDVVCTNLYSWFYRQTYDWQEICRALFQWIDKYIDPDLSGLDLSVLESLVCLIPSLLRGERDGVESAFSAIRDWICETHHFRFVERLHLLNVVRALYLKVQLVFQEQPFDSQPLRAFLHMLLRYLRLIPSASHLFHGLSLVDVLCIAVESGVNSRPVNFQPVILRVREWMENTPEIQNMHPELRNLLEYCVEFTCIFVQCMLNTPFNLKPLNELVHAWIDRTPGLSESEISDYKSEADNFFLELQSMTRKRTSILDVLPSSNDTSLSTRTTQFNDRLGKDNSLTELRVLIHTLRKRGIKVYMRHIAYEQY